MQKYDVSGTPNLLMAGYFHLLVEYSIFWNEFAKSMIKSGVVVKHHFMAMFHIYVPL